MQFFIKRLYFDNLEFLSSCIKKEGSVGDATEALLHPQLTKQNLLDSAQQTDT